MVLIFGGVYQGKFSFAEKNFSIKKVHDCKKEEDIDFEADAIIHLENFCYRCAEAGRDAVELFRETREAWKEKILIAADVTQGIVPMDALQRKYREMNGRLLVYLAGEADQVYRVFCGIGKRIK